MNLISNRWTDVGLIVNGNNKPLNRSFRMNIELKSEDISLSLSNTYINQVLSDEISKLISNVERRLSGVKPNE